MLCPTRFVVDGTENRIEEAWWPKCASLRLVYDSAFFVETIMHVYVRTIRTTKYIQRKTKKESPIEGEVSARTCTICVQMFRVYLLETEKRRGHYILVRKHVHFMQLLVITWFWCRKEFWRYGLLNIEHTW